MWCPIIARPCDGEEGLPPIFRPHAVRQMREKKLVCGGTLHGEIIEKGFLRGYAPPPGCAPWSAAAEADHAINPTAANNSSAPTGTSNTPGDGSTSLCPMPPRKNPAGNSSSAP